MSKLASAAEFNALVDSGKYESKTNAQRAAGRTRLSDAEKKKCFAHIEAVFGADGSPPAAAPKKVAKKAAKKAAKKVAAKKTAPAAAAPALTPALTPAPAPAPAPAAAPLPTGKRMAKKAKKKAAGKKKVAARAPRAEAAPAGTLPITPSQVETTGDMLKLIDSTVGNSVSIIEALQKADALSKTGDISEGVKVVKEALTGAARLMQQAVVAPLHQTVAPAADPETLSRLEQVVRASNDPFAAPAQPQEQPALENTQFTQLPQPGTALS
jgi:hypothetical protein